MTKPLLGGRPVLSRHKSMANWRAAFTTKRFLARLLLTKLAYLTHGWIMGCHLSKRQTISTKFDGRIAQTVDGASLPLVTWSECRKNRCNCL